jgi:hypothetical protein
MAQRTWLGVGCVAMMLVASAPVLAQQVRFTADADFVSYDPSGCVSSEVFVFVRQGKTKEESKDSAKAKVAVTIFQTNDCQDRTLLEARGDAKLKDGEVRFDPQLGMAKLDASVQMVDAVSNKPFAADVSLLWVAVGEPIVANTAFDVEAPGWIEKRARPVARTVRLAEASGSISDGETNFIPEPATDAAITASR